MRALSPCNIAFPLILFATGSSRTGALSVLNASGQQFYSPVAYNLGSGPNIDGLKPYTGGNLTLDSSSPVLTLDYGTEAGGFPFVQTSSVVGISAQIELKYSEPFDGLNARFGDGPWYYKLATSVLEYFLLINCI